MLFTILVSSHVVYTNLKLMQLSRTMASLTKGKLKLSVTFLPLIRQTSRRV